MGKRDVAIFLFKQDGLIVSVRLEGLIHSDFHSITSIAICLFVDTINPWSNVTIL